MSARWVTVDEAARAAHRDRRTIERWITQGRLRPQRIGGRTYLDTGAVLRVEAATRRAARTLPPKIAQASGGVVPSQQARPAAPTMRTATQPPKRTT